MRIAFPVLVAGLSSLSAIGAESPSRHLRPVPFPQVRLTDTFWAPRLETNRVKTVPHNIETCEKTGRISNFTRAAGTEPGEFTGIYFNDSDVYKMLEGASYSLALRPDRELERKLDEIIAKISSAQGKDGYLNTYFTLVEKGKRWTDLPVKHELYCAGHLFEAAVAHFRATGKRSLLDVACRFADHIGATFGPGKKSGVPGHEEIELALVKLFEVTGEERYLDLARYFIDERGRGTDRKLYGEYCQDHMPIRQQREIVGHAVRAMYLYSGAADVAAYSGDKGLIDAMDRVWDNVVHRKMYVTGGIGALATNEGFSVDYDLPNDTAYAETCASIGMALWNYRLFLLHGDGRHADVFEQVLYNGLLSGVSLDGERFFYVNPLASRGRHHRQPWFDCACCPTNVVRFIPSVGGYLYALSGDALWVNLYASSEATITLGDGGQKTAVKVTQRTSYPWDGGVRMTLEPEKPAKFAVRLRVPGWCEKLTCRLNDRLVDDPPVDRGYIELRREWAAGDQIDLALVLSPQRVESHPAVKGNAGRVAFRRGPFIYCLEAVDNGGRVGDLVVPRAAALLPSDLKPNLLGGVVLLRTRGYRVKAADWARKLYQAAVESEEVDVVAVPYYAWDNRDPGEMTVWVPESTALAHASVPPSLATGAKISASQVGKQDTLDAVNDRLLPLSSGDGTVPRFTWWDHKGTDEWIECSFPEAREVSRSEVFWFSDAARGGGCRVPSSWRLLYREGDAWHPVDNPSSYGVDGDRSNEVKFQTVMTNALRLEARLQPGFSAGILEWQLHGSR